MNIRLLPLWTTQATAGIIVMVATRKNEAFSAVSTTCFRLSSRTPPCLPRLVLLHSEIVEAVTEGVDAIETVGVVSGPHCCRRKAPLPLTYT